MAEAVVGLSEPPLVVVRALEVLAAAEMVKQQQPAAQTVLMV
jgi:hypothetical protein